MNQVRDYYDANTWKFLLSDRGERALHRELWAPGITDAKAALHHVHDLVADELTADDRRVLDLGCGVGTAAIRLARHHPVDVTGVSISPEQIRMAQRFGQQAGDLRGSVRFVTADFADLPDDLVGFDVAFAIESFVHANPAAGFFREAARALCPGGRLLVIDDVRTRAPDDPRIDEVRTGWRAESLLSLDEAEALAAAVGLDLDATIDLSGYQRLGRPRDRLVAAAQPVLRRLRHRSEWARALVGGHALQQCHRAGLLEYRLLRFVRRDP
ncbi:hypothetical protein N802_04140 [Knoellia sinensis KCTC 19936]|uniref:Methyltransferase domain-containing protein n=1 Tax=Knoellia sinensis KCTC 19936 TaxID=1385520 RepID=A0A0A0J3L0_9MICO|nr:class I SAM-dependent methyltransferase [Knoellia sinensis]KGN31284.1 hypothetical protein N802_04140 [Knoellia sinensis KCTC 19936]